MNTHFDQARACAKAIARTKGQTRYLNIRSCIDHLKAGLNSKPEEHISAKAVRSIDRVYSYAQATEVEN